MQNVNVGWQRLSRQYYTGGMSQAGEGGGRLLHLHCIASWLRKQGFSCQKGYVHYSAIMLCFSRTSRTSSTSISSEKVNGLLGREVSTLQFPSPKSSLRSLFTLAMQPPQLIFEFMVILIGIFDAFVVNSLLRLNY